jgi:hypothetical protein
MGEAAGTGDEMFSDVTTKTSSKPREGLECLGL